MAGTNRWATMSRARKVKTESADDLDFDTPVTAGRRALDDYETPPNETKVLLRDAGPFVGPVLEPCAGSGRMAKVLRAGGLRVATNDIKKGHDFLARAGTFAGDIITNPPYRDGLALAMTQKALEVADGRVAMLLQSDFLAGSRRAEKLFYTTPPELVIVIPWRIYFFVDDVPLKSQFFNNAWFVWPNRGSRESGHYDQRIVWAKPIG